VLRVSSEASWERGRLQQVDDGTKAMADLNLNQKDKRSIIAAVGSIKGGFVEELVGVENDSGMEIEDNSNENVVDIEDDEEEFEIKNFTLREYQNQYFSH
jgi:helix-turn-helix protein